MKFFKTSFRKDCFSYEILATKELVCCRTYLIKEPIARKQKENRSDLLPRNMLKKFFDFLAHWKMLIFSRVICSAKIEIKSIYIH